MKKKTQLFILLINSLLCEDSNKFELFYIASIYALLHFNFWHSRLSVKTKMQQWRSDTHLLFVAMLWHHLHEGCKGLKMQRAVCSVFVLYFNFLNHLKELTTFPSHSDWFIMWLVCPSTGMQNENWQNT